MKVKISDIRKNQEFRSKINLHDLEDIVFLDDNNEMIEIHKDVVDEFKFTGLSNIDFILSGFYEDKQIKENME